MRIHISPAWALVLVVALLGVAHLVLTNSVVSPAEAQASPTYRECFLARQETVDVNNESVVATPGRNRLIRIPQGWSVAGAGYGPQAGAIMLCR